METVLDFIFGAASNPVEMAACFMLFLCILDAIFSLISNMFGVMR